MEDDREAQRLTQKVDPAGWVERYYVPHLSSAKQVLDVGCGPGALASEIAQRFPDKTIIGVDASESRLEHARQNHVFPNLSFKCANSTELPFSDQQFDAVYSRLMLEYLHNPETAISEMARVCKPGGHVILQDLDGQIVWHYPAPDFEADIQTVLDELKKTGFDVFVGRKLFHYAKNAGLTNITVSLDPYHLYAGQISEKELKDWELKLDIVLPQIEKVHGKEKSLAIKHQFLSYLQDENTLTYSVMFTVVGQATS